MMGFTMDLPVYPVGGSWFTQFLEQTFKKMRCSKCWSNWNTNSTHFPSDASVTVNPNQSTNLAESCHVHLTSHENTPKMYRDPTMSRLSHSVCLSMFLKAGGRTVSQNDSVSQSVLFWVPHSGLVAVQNTRKGLSPVNKLRCSKPFFTKSWEKL